MSVLAFERGIDKVRWGFSYELKKAVQMSTRMCSLCLVE
jgi:hypothetical protein